MTAISLGSVGPRPAPWTLLASISVDGAGLLASLHASVDAVAAELQRRPAREPTGGREGEYAHDLAADAVAVASLIGAGFGVLSEESGWREAGRPLLAVLDPVDGSTNASRGLPWFATSICVLDELGPLAAVVANLVSGSRYEAVVGLSGYSGHHLGWRQYRALGAAALDLCAVADGTLDAFVDCVDEPHGGVWDYLGALLVCREAGAVVVDRHDRELVVRSSDHWRSPVAASSPELLAELRAALVSPAQTGNR